MAAALNDSGQTLRKALETKKVRLDVPWSEHNFKEIFLTAYLESLYGVESISDLDTKQITDLYEAMNDGIGQVFGVSMPFPSEDDL